MECTLFCLIIFSIFNRFLTKAIQYQLNFCLNSIFFRGLLITFCLELELRLNLKIIFLKKHLSISISFLSFHASSSNLASYYIFCHRQSDSRLINRFFSKIIININHEKVISQKKKWMIFARIYED